MRGMLVLCALLALAACERRAPAEAPAPPPVAAPQPPSFELSCAAFSQVTAAGLGRQYGDANVSVQTLPGPEGSEAYQATVLFADDPAKRIEIVWDDATDHPSSVTIHGDASQWRKPDGVTLGSDMAAVEQANGGPFMLSGFDWDYGGQVSDWRGGNLSKESCHIGVGFNPTTQTYPSGEAQVASSAPPMRAAHAKVTQIVLTYPDE